ncbi:MAG: aldehyde dehydrogenase, partial [Ferruginibacter sp.]|nr:aldehyde dehydrogenase [Ferruginibacter sp.]
SCEFGEDAAQKAYTTALASDAEISAEVRTLITDQQATLKIAHNLIKKYRDLHHAINS